MKILHIPCFHRKNVLPVLEKNIHLLDKYDRVALVSTAQHLNQLDAVKEFLESKNKKCLKAGQILGCSQMNALKLEGDVEVFLYIGSGFFHPIGLSVKTEKPVVILNPYSDSMEELSTKEKERWLKRQKGRLAKFLEADSVGILVSTKAGQFSMEDALGLKKRLGSEGKNVFLFAGEELNPANLLPFKVDCWVNTACPRLADDKFEKSIVNAEELDIL